MMFDRLVRLTYTKVWLGLREMSKFYLSYGSFPG